jgi:quinol monooxygenase YgiN
MPTLPWTPAEAAADRAGAASGVLVFGSRLELRSYRHIVGFLRAAMRLRRQVHRAPGALGVSLIAQPLRKTFWTLSAWTDQDAIDGFVRTPAHQDVMRRFNDRLAGTGFVSWTVDAAEVPNPHSNAKDLWRDAHERLAGRTANST